MSVIRFVVLINALLLLCSINCAAEPADVFEDVDEFPVFDDQPLAEPLEFPDWFSISRAARWPA